MLKSYPSAIDYLTNWLDSKVQLAHKSKVIIPVSGGIDSAVVSDLCARTNHNVLAISMPVHGKGSPLANIQLQWLTKKYPKVETRVYDIGTLVDAALATHSEVATNLHKANLTARQRMVMAYLAAGSDALVIGTGNKVEDYGLGFFTKYGDGGCDLNPIGDLLKSEVRAMGVYMELEPDIIHAAPTDGLWEDGRTDEDAIGMTYKEAEWAMQFHEDQVCPEMEKDHISKILKIVPEGRRKAYRIFRDWHDATRHKMSPPPICELPEHFHEEG